MPTGLLTAVVDKSALLSSYSGLRSYMKQSLFAFLVFFLVQSMQCSNIQYNISVIISSSDPLVANNVALEPPSAVGRNTSWLQSYCVS